MRLQLKATKRYASLTISADLDLPLTGVTALFGVSGSGKSTLINLLAGLVRPDHGRIAVGEQVFFDAEKKIDLPIQARQLGVVFQEARLFPHLSVRSNLLFGFKRAVRQQRTKFFALDAVVQLLALEHLLDRPPYTLSGGERQRVAIGRALLAQPRLLLMDEPLASLDASRKAELLPYIERLRDELLLPMVYVSHAWDEVSRLASSLVLLDGGQVQAAGAVDELLRNDKAQPLLAGMSHSTLITAQVIAHDPRHALTTLAGDGFQLTVALLNQPVGQQVRLRIAASSITLALEPLLEPFSRSSIDNCIAGRVVSVGLNQSTARTTGTLVQVRVSNSVVLSAQISCYAAARLALTAGQPCWCLISAISVNGM